MQDLTITLIQSALHWQNKAANFEKNERIFETLGKTDLVILPEMFTTGFTMQPEQLAEDFPGESVDWMATQARRLNAVITGSIAVRESGHYYNRLIWMRPSGEYETYDKRHLFRMAGEDKHYSAGQKRLIVEYKGWRICPLVCYDLRFPVWSRNRNDYDLLIYVANWPRVRRDPWRALLPARAIENLCYVVGVNRVGEDGNGFAHSGDSMVIGPKGNSLFHSADEEISPTITLSSEALIKFRERFPAHKDADDFVIQ